MKILVLSDSHQFSLTDLEFEKYDAVIHCGDYGNSEEVLVSHHVLYVRGNCDGSGRHQIVENLFGRKIFVAHGYQENVKYGLDRLIYKALEKEVEVCFFGHTHQQMCFIEENILFLNPGSYPNSYIEITEEEIQFYEAEKIKVLKYRW